ncbi:pre-toxin TG domain-containing protein [Legionella sp.]|uniref:pre-toxin TG domain-containing protein n=1 Tax=Legionella sp. TaxID=459 RepID=UPI003D0C082F
MALDFIPIVGQLKAAEEVWSGKELFSGERINRGLAALGLVPGGKLAYTALKGLGKTGSKVGLLGGKTAPNKASPMWKSPEWYEDVAFNATRNAESDRLVLGHFAKEGTSYQRVASHYDATYFKVDKWNEVTKGLSIDETWKINKTFLTQQISQGKQILFSHNPLKAKMNSFFEREVDFLKDLGYKFEQKNQWTWEALLHD